MPRTRRAGLTGSPMNAAAMVSMCGWLASCPTSHASVPLLGANLGSLGYLTEAPVRALLDWEDFD